MIMLDARQHIFPIVSEHLAAPFATSYPPLLLSCLDTLEIVLADCWPRVAHHRGEILRGLTILWVRIDEEGNMRMELGKVRERTRRAVRGLEKVLEGEGFEYKQEWVMLREGDERLNDLLVVDQS